MHVLGKHQAYFDTHTATENGSATCLQSKRQYYFKVLEEAIDSW